MEEELLQRIEELENLVYNLESRIECLESENVGTTNELYELQHRLDILNHPKYSGLKNFTLGNA
jgi:hypothetical protein